MVERSFLLKKTDWTTYEQSSIILPSSPLPPKNHHKVKTGDKLGKYLQHIWKRVINPLIDEFLATINIPVEKWAKEVTIQLTQELKMARVNAKITWVLIKEMLNWRRPLSPAELAKIKKINTQYLQKSWENGNCLDSVPKSLISISYQDLTRHITSEHTSSSSIWEFILRKHSLKKYLSTHYVCGTAQSSL